ncbi:hypothetical protein [Dehalobacterium formicoaceticum]|uniref:Uncharacterized protein n=1 Tax=Dehalobacterium formicoaceticum TaxID=51515 RepID=A0ABT1Y3N4_9FIRM|nr:hypothetical protein [Dehalobacterium formicoaceticum]MCR6544301.1 hypothetical protein [Dehalobacterium formicoaceticum]
MDRFHRGLAAGIIAGIPMNIWDLFSYHYLKFSNLRYLDWNSVMIFGHLPYTMGEVIFALLSQFLLAGFLGMIFTYLIELKITSRNHWLKGVVFGYLAGYLIFAVAVTFQVPYIITRSLDTVITQFIGALIWGLTMSYILSWLDKTKLVEKK